MMCEYTASPINEQSGRDPKRSASYISEDSVKIEEPASNDIGVLTVDSNNGGPRYANMAYWANIFGDVRFLPLFSILPVCTHLTERNFRSH